MKTDKKLSKQSAEDLKEIQEHLKKVDHGNKHYDVDHSNKHYDNAHEFQAIVNTLIHLYDAPYISWSVGGGEFNIFKGKGYKETSDRITFDRDEVVDLIPQEFIKLITDNFVTLITSENTNNLAGELITEAPENHTKFVSSESENSVRDLLHRIEMIVETLKLDEKYFTYDRIGYYTHNKGIITMYVRNVSEGDKKTNKSFDFPINIISNLDNKNLVKVVKEAYESIIETTPVIPHEGDHSYLPSRFKHGDNVILHFPGNGKIIDCIIHAIHFTASKVKYDLNIPITITRIGEKSHHEWTRIYNVDSCFVEEPINIGKMSEAKISYKVSN